MPAYGGLLTEIIHPFARASTATITVSTGAAYGATVSTVGSTSYITVEEVTIPVPTNAMMTELQVAATIGLGITTTTDSPKFKVLIKDNAQTSYDTIVNVTSTTLAALASTTNLTDFSASLNVTPSSNTYFTGKGTFQIACQVAANASTSNALGAVKSSGYVMYSYYLVG